MNVREYVESANQALRALPVDAIDECVDRIQRAYESSRAVFIVGNGGSAAAASHLAQDLAKGVVVDRAASHRIRALSLTDNVSYITAVANDDGYEYVYSTQLRTWASDGDLLIVISTSGRSRNILEALAVAKRRNMAIIGVTGGADSPLRDASDLVIAVPVTDVGLIEGVHAVVFHYIVAALRDRISGVPVDAAALTTAGALRSLLPVASAAAL